MKSRLFKNSRLATEGPLEEEVVGFQLELNAVKSLGKVAGGAIANEFEISKPRVSGYKNGWK